MVFRMGSRKAVLSLHLHFVLLVGFCKALSVDILKNIVPKAPSKCEEPLVVAFSPLACPASGRPQSGRSCHPRRLPWRMQTMRSRSTTAIAQTSS